MKKAHRRIEQSAHCRGKSLPEVAAKSSYRFPDGDAQQTLNFVDRSCYFAGFHNGHVPLKDK
jgi:hypothetical protein